MGITDASRGCSRSLEQCVMLYLDLGDSADWFVHGLWNGYHCLLLLYLGRKEGGVRCACDVVRRSQSSLLVQYLGVAEGHCSQI